ncbi:hypothetical protein [Heliophilum fasciatum]|uniref:Uncharacterized protein n=1 Tax=Heliophilum fasciatum TaxID=35700 RepID=A0A4R2RLH1_9FIRM|nr:hypothetical protein [Heliophilum fasciatum]MCW2277723.1 hypothetical protein [Heliophilum fasciatum]TCP64782.1 hypothetical protein EDD73_108135 [Heliophilum fasciatum]
MKFLTNIDLNKNELQNARIQNLSSAPTSPVEGQVYHNTLDHKTYMWNGTAWIDLTASTKVDKINAAMTTSAKVTSSVTKAAGSASTDVFRVESADSQELFSVKQNGDTVVGGKLTINGSGITTGTATDLTLSGNLTVQGSTTLGDNASQDTTTINGVTKVVSKATKSAGSSTADAFRVESSDAQPLLQVRENGDTVIGGVLTVNGAGTSTFAGNVSIGGKLTVADTATATAALNGTDLTLAGNLVVQGDTTLGNEAADNTSVQGTLDVSRANIKYDGTANRITATELGYIDGLTSNAQTQLNAKLNTSDADNANTANKVVKRDASGNFAAGTITATKVTGLSAPSADSDAATKAYVDTLKMGFDYKDSVRVATTTNINLTTGGMLSIDGITVAAGDRVLVKNQTTASQNGIYTAAAGAWTRSTDANGSSKVTSGMYVFVSEGATNGKTGWVLTTADPITLNTTALSFSQFSGAGTYTAGNGITLTGNLFSVVSHAGTAGAVGTVVSGADGKLGVSLGTTSTTAAAGDHNHDGRYYTETEMGSTTAGSSGAKKVGTPALSGVTGTDVEAQLSSLKTLIDDKEPTITSLPITKGGTGATTAAAARTNLGATTKYSANVGDGTATTFTVTHNLGTMDVVVTVREAASPYNVVFSDIQIVDNNSIKLLFAAAPSASQYRVNVIG